METKYAFDDKFTGRAIPFENGGARPGKHMTYAAAARRGYTLLEWPLEDGKQVLMGELGDHIPEPPDPAMSARAARLEAITGAPEAANVSPDVLETLADRDIPIADARGLLRGLSPRAISNQFRGKPDNEPMTETPATTDDPKAARLRELRANVSPTRATANAAQLIAADTDPKRARLLEIKIGGIMSRAEHGDRAAIAKRKEIESACILARANNLPLIHALAVAGVKL